MLKHKNPVFYNIFYGNDFLYIIFFILNLLDNKTGFLVIIQPFLYKGIQILKMDILKLSNSQKNFPLYKKKFSRDY